jgi:hypothetical protein
MSAMKLAKILSVATLAVFAAGCSSAPAVRRLSPAPEQGQAPKTCVIVNVFPNTPAQRFGLQINDVVRTVNGRTPADAAEVADLINASPAEATLTVQRADASTQTLKIQLNAGKPRLGAVCDLSGWRKSGITAAGNESITLFSGPFSVTGSGILDKGLVFMRVRVSNNSDKPLKVGPDLFTAADGNRTPLNVMTPQQVMCYLYGDKGAQLLAAKRRQKETLDPDTAPKEARLTDETCAAGSSTGRVSGADLQYAQANADYVAEESFWPTTLAPGATADGLIYMTEPGALPLHLQAKVEEKTFTMAFGMPQASLAIMEEGDIARFLEQQKKGNALRVTMKKGKVLVGKFASYDNIEEKLWLSAASGGLLNSAGIPLRNIRAAEPMEQLPPKTAPVSEHLN